MSVQGECRPVQPLEKEMQREVNQRGEGRGVQRMERVGKRSWVRWSGEGTESQPGWGGEAGEAVKWCVGSKSGAAECLKV